MIMLQQMEIFWPVLRFGKPKCRMLRYDSANELCKGTLMGISRFPKMEEYFIVDSIGRKFLLSDPQLQCDMIWPRRFFAWLANTMQPIDFRNVSLTCTLSVDELRKLVLKDFQDYPDIWVESDLGYVQSELHRAATHQDIIRLF